MFTAKSVGRLLKRHLDEPVRSGERTLVLRRKQDAHTKMFSYCVEGVTRRAAGFAGLRVCGFVLAPPGGAKQFEGAFKFVSARA